jgi:lipopolysaccharide transport system permease protein
MRVNPHRRHPASPFQMVATLWHNRSLILQMAKREVIGRYRGSVIGLAWSFFNPLLMLVIYTFVFSVVFNARWGTRAQESRTEFAIVLFVGLIIHGLFSECVNRAPGLILANVNYVKKVVFPLEILPYVAMGSALFHSAVSLVVLLLAEVTLLHQLPWTAVLFPFTVLPLLLATMGFAWFLAALGVYVRDIGQVTGVFTALLLFLSPVFYPVSAVPREYQMWLQLNPLTFIIQEGRKTLVFGDIPDLAGFCAALLAGVLIAAGGFWCFQKMRKGFADVL